ncbi:NADPH-dependent FMN reductase [Actinoplanes sp. N902-109]|uniref:NADPH-dependent FMN reductase n=1 Tax=Actinoplanes sp. (strain N902-109) TaxID=649831 RepID=UPI0003295975|nr:NADPH-dependent FMN reductase [Actinoplanes sp. N902-109]AGL15435.1 putative NADPH-dependent FMN reductase [Actinoplanes sp. N902-109]
MTRILLIPGSIRESSLHTAALRTAARVAPADLLLDLYDGLRGLPAFAPGEQHDAVTILRHQVSTADAILFCTPEYAGSLPGSLKNMLDWLVEGAELWDKPVAWLSVVAPGQDQGALSTLETVLSHGNARVLRSAVIRLPLEPDCIGADGLVTDPRLHTALADMLHAVTFALAAKPREKPSWDVQSSLFPAIEQRQFSAGPRPNAPRHLRGSS